MNSWISWLSRFDAWAVLLWSGRVWIVVYGLSGWACTLIANEFLNPNLAIWMAWLIGIPLATILSIFAWFILMTMETFLACIRKTPKLIPEVSLKRRVITLLFLGLILSVTALFSHLNPFGKSPDFSLTNCVDASLTLLLTILVWKTRHPLAGFVLWSYWTLWKMAFWPLLQPNTLFFIGILISLILWQGCFALIYLRAASGRSRCTHSP